MAARLSGGRASIIGAQAVDDVHGTLLVNTTNVPGTAHKPPGAIGCFVYCVDREARMRVDAEASTALTYPMSAYLQSDGTYDFALNPGVSYVSFFTTNAGTPDAGTIRIGWVMGAGA